jgi:RNA polymerase sigma-70 factor (ECF subfamily)
MTVNEDTRIGGKRHTFPTTQWTMLEVFRGSKTTVRKEIINSLIQAYWKPVYCYIRRLGYGNEDAKDLTQEFFTDWFVGQKFKAADRKQGRFRSFLLKSLNNFLKNVHRHEKAKHRSPAGGIIPIEEVIKDEGIMFEPRQEESPEDIFNRTWLLELLLRVLRMFEQECQATGKEAHYELFRRCIIEPALEGVKPPPRAELAQNLGLTEKEASNRLLTARRAFQRLLREEIRSFALSEDDEAFETRDLFHFLTSS